MTKVIVFDLDETIGHFVQLSELDWKLKQVKKFLSKGNKVRISVMFRGREITHPELGMNVLKTIKYNFSFWMKLKIRHIKIIITLKGFCLKVFYWLIP